MSELSTIAPRPAPFTWQRTITGFDVICTDTGRPVVTDRESAQSANGIAQTLNSAAKEGPRALARALGCY